MQWHGIYTDRGIGKLIVNNIAKKVYASHIGTNKVTGEKMKSGEIEVVLTFYPWAYLW